jgi:hypothetical protein
VKYFTPELWIGFNSARRESAFKAYDRRLRSYRRQLAALLPRLNPPARSFFRDVCLLHDCTLARLEVGDRIESPDEAPTRRGINTRRASVRLFVLSEDGENVYTLHYKNVTRVEVNFPGKQVLFPTGMYPNFGDWGYDELTSAKNGLFRHEVLFASGSTFSIEFKKFAIHKLQIGS